MIGLSREAAVLEEAIKVRAKLRGQFQELVASQAAIIELTQSLKILEREARGAALRNSIVSSTSDQSELVNNTNLQAESNIAFRTLDDNLKVAASQIAILKKMILDLDEIITNAQARSGVIT